MQCFLDCYAPQWNFLCFLSVLLGVHHLTLQEQQVMKQVAIPKDVYTGTCNQLFDFLAQQLAEFIKEQEEKHNVRQTAPTHSSNNRAAKTTQA